MKPWPLLKRDWIDQPAKQHALRSQGLCIGTGTVRLAWQAISGEEYLVEGEQAATEALQYDNTNALAAGVLRRTADRPAKMDAKHSSISNRRLSEILR